MIEYNNTPVMTQRTKSGVIQSVIFCFALGVSTTLSTPAHGDGPIDIIGGKTTGKQLPLDHIGLPEAVAAGGIAILGGLSDNRGGGMNIHIPMEDIQALAIQYCSSNPRIFLQCLDLYLSSK